MLRTLWKFRLLVILAALVLVAGGAIAVAAKEGTFTSDNHHASAGESQQGSRTGQEATSTPGTEPTHPAEPTATPKPPEPTPVPHTTVAGVITSVDCAGGSITINEDNNGGSFTAALTGGTVYTISGQPGTCSDLKVGSHVSIEAVDNGQGWTAEHVAQDDSGSSGGGGGGGGDATPTPGPSH